MVNFFLVFVLFQLEILPQKKCYDPGEVFFVKTQDEKIVVRDVSIGPIMVEKGFKLFLVASDLFEKETKLHLPDTKKEIILKICKKEFPVKKYYFPKELVDLSPQDLERVNAEKEKFDRIWNTVTPTSYFDGSFLIPVTGTIKYNFGERRFINDEERSPHTGIDIYAEEGTPVMASGRGIVVFAGETFFGGNSLIIDHGQGIYTMYFHLKGMFVKEGEMVENGKIIGSVGKTGRATGPHLHWGVRIGGARADPVFLLEAFEKFGIKR